jgi:hypothetical protein
MSALHKRALRSCALFDSHNTIYVKRTSHSYVGLGCLLQRDTATNLNVTTSMSQLRIDATWQHAAAACGTSSSDFVTLLRSTRPQYE